MKRTELRIGNYLDFNGEIVEVTEIGKETFSFSPIQSLAKVSVDDNAISKIPLTEEWLVKMGFRHVKEESHPFSSVNFFHYENDNCWIYLIKEGFEIELNVGDERFNLFRTYKYVHQLQNLYHALTKEELKITEQ